MRCTVASRQAVSTLLLGFGGRLSSNNLARLLLQSLGI
jgi:hypothetical protein